MNPTVSEAHQLVIRFLEHYGYTETISTFRSEAGRLAYPTETNTLVDTNIGSLSSHLSHLQLERQNDIPSGDFEFYTTLNQSYSNIHESNILTSYVHPETQVVATSSTDKTVKLHRLVHENGDILTEEQISPIRIYQHHQAPVLSIDFHPLYSHIMLTTSMDGSAVIVDTSIDSSSTGHNDDNKKIGVIQEFKNHQKYVVRGLFSPKEGNYFVTASYDKTICIYENKNNQQHSSNNDIPQYELIKKMGPFIGNVETICFMPMEDEVDHNDDDDDNKNKDIILVVGIQNDNYLHFISMGNQDQKSPFELKKMNLNANGDDWVSFSPAWLSFCPSSTITKTNPLLLITTDHTSGRMILLDSVTGHQIQNYYINPTDNKFVTKKHVFHPSGKYFYIIGGDDHDEEINTIKIIETKTGSVEATLDGHEAMIRSICLHSDIGLVTAGFDHKLILWSKASLALH